MNESPCSTPAPVNELDRIPQLVDQIVHQIHRLVPTTRGGAADSNLAHGQPSAGRQESESHLLGRIVCKARQVSDLASAIALGQAPERGHAACPQQLP